VGLVAVTFSSNEIERTFMEQLLRQLQARCKALEADTHAQAEQIKAQKGYIEFLKVRLNEATKLLDVDEAPAPPAEPKAETKASS
jgi:hypothetical protein